MKQFPGPISHPRIFPFAGSKVTEKLEKESVLLIAGKGHENFQILKDKEIEFNDLTILNELKDVI